MSFGRHRVMAAAEGDERWRAMRRGRAQLLAQNATRRVRLAVRGGFACRLLLRVRPQHAALVKAALLGALAYFVLPFDFIPDLLPFIGYTDDAAVLATASSSSHQTSPTTIALPRAMRWRVG